MPVFLSAALLAAAAPSAAAPAPAPAARQSLAVAAGAATPEDLYGPLFRAVELARVFPDSKTFADMIPNAAPADIMAAYRAERPAGRDALAAFVARFFVQAEARPAQALPLRAHIQSLWAILSKPPLATKAGSSALALPYAYVVPGGRYQEFYYWDTYFTMLGLKADGQTAMVESMLDNFVSLIERYGHIPNGTRSYYLSRSQPPYFALMLALSDNHDPAVARRRLAALKAEHRYWMAGAACLDASGACQHVVRMPDGSLLNRYWDARDTPRDESYVEDVATSAAAGPRPVNRDLRAAAESGWDFSARWLGDYQGLATIRTTEIVPIDLNSLLWAMEESLARRCAEAGDAAAARDFAAQAAARKAAIGRWLWSADEARFVDWDRARKAPTPIVSAALLTPLFVGLATPDQAHATAARVRRDLLAPGGMRTTTRRTGQQWDAPNGWAPLHWIAVEGLSRYGEDALARTIADRWLATVNRLYKATGRVVEKYDVETQAPGGGGEYAVQDGFGWTNGSVSALMQRYGIADRDLP
ncbi:alpha,alpha-trehalase TreF [Sphingomonas morindae]|uniref:Alpha,alpha-trehalase TreF n=1 Tax=Sphingomonas morindae TaxID=1541170 RepID=A0ABY4XD38_9SPHN|nr:alpha,alpha-trehalase TreF [Sphingomonas morindae]USI74890.1 alpha,alpha-trehalase TreF [Sphingomonas morindae]